MGERGIIKVFAEMMDKCEDTGEDPRK